MLAPVRRAAALLVAGAWALPPGGAASGSGLEVRWEPAGTPRAPLALRAAFELSDAADVAWVVDDGIRVKRRPLGDLPRGAHDEILLGFRPGAHHTLHLEATLEDGARLASEEFSWTAPTLPDRFPPLHVTVLRRERMEPGYTLLPCSRWPADRGIDRGFGALVALDEYGDVAWFYDAPHAVSEVKRMSTGNLLYYAGTNGNVIELDMLGNVVRQWHTTRIPGREAPEGAIPIDASTIHHDVSELPNGNLLALSTELRRFESYPASEDDPDVPPAPSRVIGDVILEFQPDGTVVDRIPVLDLLDPYRIGYESLDWGFWSHVYQNLPEEPLRDWAHVNSVQYDAQDDAYIVSSYHQDAVFKVDRETRELVWILGFPQGWGERWMPHLLSPVGEGLYPFHQHAARVTPERTLLMFDNGKYRALPFAPKMPPEESFSRAVEFAIDEETMEFRQIWSYGGRPGEIFFTPFLGETDWLPRTGNVLITDGGRVRRPDGRPGVHPRQGRKWARVLEVTRETPALVVFEVVVDDPSSGWTVYRSERLERL